MTQKAIIAETEHIIAIEQDVDSDWVVVTFNGLGFERNGLQFWGDDFLLKQKISAVGIVTWRPNWYPRRAMDDVISIVREKTKGRKVVTYGNSQGGYGALKFAARLKASTALAFVPQWSINPADVASFDTRFISYFDEELGNGLRIEQDDLCDHSFIFFDKMEKADAGNVARLAALRGVKTVVAPFSMHNTISIATEGRGAAKIISLCASTTPPAVPALRQVIRASRKQSKTYFDYMLRTLILRLSRSVSRSSKFVSDLLDKTKNDNPFYTALIAHARCNMDLAHSELRKATGKNFENVNLMALWQLSNQLRYADAERAVAAQICERHPRNTAACLRAVTTLIRVGNLDGAHDELKRIAKNDDAASHIGHFVELSLKLRKREILESFLSESLPHLAKATILFRLVGFYQRLGDRQSAFRKLMEFAETCTDSPSDLRKIAGHLVQLGEYSFALDIRERLLQVTPGDHLLALDVVEARIPSNRKRALADLKDILRAPQLPLECWERASHLYERLGEVDGALRAISKAVTFRGAGPGARQRLVMLLARKGLTRRARDVLESLLVECRTDQRRLRMLGDLAFTLTESILARKRVGVAPCPR